MTSENFECPGFYKCHDSNVCLSHSDICDGESQCPQEDDEWHCGFTCPRECSCSDLTYFCQGNQLVTVPTRVDKKARKLDLSHNRIFVEEITFRGFFWLGKLLLRSNNITSIFPQSFSDLVNLFLLDLSHNDLRAILPGTFDKLNNLNTLNLQGNRFLTSVEHDSFRGLTKLPILSLEGMSIEVLNNDIFMGLDSLLELRLSNNSIVQVLPNAFLGIPMLRRLILPNNPKINIPKLALDQLLELRYLETDNFKYCCYVRKMVPEKNCLPERDEFSSCEDLMRRPVLKSFLWILGLMAFLCNLFVLVWRAREKPTVYSLCVMNLAVADFFMGLYMVVLASVDAYYSGVYIQYAENWKSSWLCQILGFLNTLSSEASVFSLCLISADRFYKIVFPFKGNKFGIRQARYALLFLWFVALVISALPLLPISYFDGQFYSRSSVCLSLHITNEISPGWEYSVAIFHGLNFTCFVFIFCAYAYIYSVIRESHSSTGRHTTRPANTDVALARRLVLVVATDFLCWIPINMMGKDKASLGCSDRYLFLCLFIEMI